GVAVVAVDSPRVEHALQVDQLVARPAQVVHHLLRASLHQRLPDPPRDVVERLVPCDALPLAAAALAGTSHRIADALGIGDLGERGRPLGAVAAAAAGVDGVAFEFLDSSRRPVHVGEQAAGRLAVEADGRNQAVTALDLPWPRDGVVLLPIVPALRRRITGEAFGDGQLARAGVQWLGDRPLYRDVCRPRIN